MTFLLCGKPHRSTFVAVFTAVDSILIFIISFPSVRFISHRELREKVGVIFCDYCCVMFEWTYAAQASYIS